jgi:four helix bundle protein
MNYELRGMSYEFSVVSDQHQKPSQSYRALIAWQKGVLPARSIYRLTSRFPNEEEFGLISWLRRAAVMVPSNPADGQAGRPTGAFAQFISRAEGSIAELNTQLTPAVELEFYSEPDASEAKGLIQELRKMLNALHRTVSTHNS